MICKSCKSIVSEGSRFCPKCGREIDIYTCVACGTEIPGDSSFCPNCGKETIIQFSTQPAPTTPHFESVPQPLSNVVAKAPVPFPHGKKRRIGLITFIIALICIAGVAFLYIYHLNRQVTAKENGELWASANNILATFVGDNLPRFAVAETSPITPEETYQVIQQISDFDTALKALEAVKPPSDQVIVQKMLLPMYRRIYNQMITIKDALIAGAPLKLDLEVQRMQLLLEELGGALDMLSSKTVPGQTMTLTLAFGERTGTYMGEKVDGLPDGYGKFTCANSEGVEWTYEGQWAAGHWFGQGATVWDNGVSIGGWYENDSVNGQGWERWSGVMRYEGGYLDSKYNGQGKLYNYHGEIVYSGPFIGGIIQESTQNRLARVGAFKNRSLPSAPAELYGACQKKISMRAYVSGKIFQILQYPESNPTYCTIKIYADGVNARDNIVCVYYTLSEGEAVPKEGQMVKVWGTTEYLYSYTTNAGDYLTTPLLEAWSVE
jgi:RNA polymerase subunit RPABC4/transcription elongation factor Spt4